MSILEEITGMQNEGIPEEGIITSLREKGVSPKEIKDAISQLKIKHAISDYETTEKEEENPPQKVQSNQEFYPPQPAMQDYEFPQQAYPQEEYSPQEYSSQDEYGYSPSPGVDANTVIEVSEQVFSEKIKPLKKDLESFNEFKSINQIRMENLNERLKRIEIVFDKLQITILEKIGSYGQNLETIKKEMSMVQNSFSKIVDPLVDHSEKIYKKKKRSKKK